MSVAIDTNATVDVDKGAFDEDFEENEAQEDGAEAPYVPRTFWATCNFWC